MGCKSFLRLQNIVRPSIRKGCIFHRVKDVSERYPLVQSLLNDRSFDEGIPIFYSTCCVFDEFDFYCRCRMIFFLMNLFYIEKNVNKKIENGDSNKC